MNPGQGCSSFSRSPFTKLLFLLSISLLLVFNVGCATHRVKVDFKGFEMAYAETSNREMLLNLARLQNHDPTYFFKLGQITSQYRMAATLGGSGSYSLQTTNVGAGAPIGGGTTGLSYENDPIFQFIPVNDDTNAQLLLKPIPADTFYILYQQGWRIDQLIRLMVDRIEVTAPVKGGGCDVSTYRNTPPLMSRPKNSKEPATVLDQDQLSAYVSFLRISAIAYGMQKHGDLLLRDGSFFSPLDPEAEGVSEAAKAADDKPTDAKPSNTVTTVIDRNTATITVNPAPKPEKDNAAINKKDDTTIAKQNNLSASDVEKAAEKNFSYEKVGDKVLIGQRIVSPKFYLLPPNPTSAAGAYQPDTDKIKGIIEKDPDLAASLEDSLVLTRFINALQDGFTIEGDATIAAQASDPCPGGITHATAHLVLRSLIGVMAAAAQEQGAFDDLNNATPSPTIEEQAGTRQYNFQQAVPEMERLPILRINWKRSDDPTPPIIEVGYRGMNYLIADSTQQSVSDQYWNRDVFRLISALLAQVTVDVSKYPVPDILQVNPQ